MIAMTSGHCNTIPSAHLKSGSAITSGEKQLRSLRDHLRLRRSVMIQIEKHGRGQHQRQSAELSQRPMEMRAFPPGYIGKIWDDPVLILRFNLI